MIETIRKTIVPEDDISVGQLLTVINMKNGQPAPIMGQSLLVTFIHLPFIIAKLIAEPMQPVLTLDVRYMNFMRIPEEYAIAQANRKSTK